MSYTTSVTYTGNGSLQNYTIPFPFLEEDDVLVYLNSVATTAFTFLSASTLRFTVAPANGVTILIRRKTDIDLPEIDYSDGSTLTAADMDKDSKQALYLIQELKDEMLALFASIAITTGNLPAVTNDDNGKVLQVVAGAWALVSTTKQTVVTTYQVDGATRKFQKKTRQVDIISNSPSAESDWTDVHTGGVCS